MPLIDRDLLVPLLKHRADVSHKGDYGHLLLVCGCETMPGAAVLATSAALRSGCGLVTLHSTHNASVAAVTACPSAMLSPDPQDCFSQIPSDLGKYSAIAVGPGLGRDPRTVRALKELLAAASSLSIPMVLDADALNIIASNPEFMTMVPDGSVLTPHQGELRRLAAALGPLDRADRVYAGNCTVVSKGYHTRVWARTAGAGTMDPYINTTGNPGMAKGGSGDVLTGLVGGLLARGYESDAAAMLGVWIHGYAGDMLTLEKTAEAYGSMDLASMLYAGFEALYG